MTQKSLAPVEVFLGVPYATPPSGANRFSPTRSVPPWAGVRLCDRLAPVCPQPPLNLNVTLSRGKLAALRRLAPFLEPYNEDCLYLNVYAPAPLTGKQSLLLFFKGVVTYLFLTLTVSTGWRTIDEIGEQRRSTSG